MAIYLAGQQCQCPPLAVPLITDAVLTTTATVGSAGASFAGAIVGAHFAPPSKLRRDEQVKAPPGVPQYNFDLCAQDLTDPSVTVTVEGPVENHGMFNSLVAE